ncbi:MAG: translation initiation factor IF-2 [Acidobacteria bacterium]|nr:translation initiation factor IF-2 [Acidobacteriota bacterium]
MAKIRVRDMAKQMGIPAKDLVFKLQSLGVQIESEDAAVDHAAIIGALSGRQAVRPRAVIMRDEKAVSEPQREARARKVRPPRPIVKPTRPVAPPKEAPSSPAPTDQAPAEGPVIQEFIEAAEAEAKERAAQEAAEAEARKKAPKTPVVKKPVRITPPRQPDRPTPSEAPAVADRGRTGPTGPRARAMTRPRPDYGDQRPAQRPAQRPSSRSGERPSSRPGERPSSRPGERPASRVARPQRSAPLYPGEPQPVPTSAPTARRRKESEGDRIEKKQQHAGRRRRSAEARRETDESLFHKGPFSARTVLEEDPEPQVPVQPSSRKDKRKQAGPVTDKGLEFEKPKEKITLSEGVTVKDLADKLNVRGGDLLTHLIKKGRILTINTPLESELALEIANELGIEAEFVTFEEAIELEEMEREGEGDVGLEPRAPVITVMGHVDHGKTSLLDAIRKTKVAEGEAGGITQHIGAYAIEQNGQKIVFLDTPGHEAFTLMRARGASATDIVVLVVAADDGVMPQTREAIDHSRAARVPVIVAINKVDKPNANVERVKQELSQNGILVEDWGGDVTSVQVSALKKTGIDELLEVIQLTAEMLELKSSPSRAARGVVLEASKEQGRGNVATVLVQDGTLRIGDHFVSGLVTGKVKAMTDDLGKRLKEAPPATPVSVMGFDELPDAGDRFIVVDEASEARTITEQRQEKKSREAGDRRGSKMSLDSLYAKMQQGEAKELNLIIKGDVQGSVEVLRDSLEKLSTEKVRVKVMHASVGAVSTNDVLLATASNGIIIGFNVRPEKNAADLAAEEGVEIRLHTIIYELIDEIKLAMAGLLEPIREEVYRGRAEVRDLFKVPKAGTIAGCYVVDGVIPRTAQIRLLRDNRVVHEGKISSLRHFKDDVSEVRQGFECGIGIERYNDVKVGDVIEAFVTEERAASLE